MSNGFDDDDDAPEFRVKPTYGRCIPQTLKRQHPVKLVPFDDLKRKYEKLEEANRILSGGLTRHESNADVGRLTQQIEELEGQKEAANKKVKTLLNDEKKLNTELRFAQADAESFTSAAEQRVETGQAVGGANQVFD